MNQVPSRRRLSLALALSALAGALAHGPVGAAANAADQTDQIIVKYRDGGRVADAMADQPSLAMAPRALERRAQLAAVAKRHGASMEVRRISGGGAEIWRLEKPMDTHAVVALAKALTDSDPDVEYAEPDAIAHHFAAAPNDPYWRLFQWSMQNSLAGINVPAAWDFSTGNNVVVAVIDSGIRPHVDFANRILPGFDMISYPEVARDNQNNPFNSDRDQDPTDTGTYGPVQICGPDSNPNSSWHGTKVAGIIAANTNNGLGTAGIAYSAKVLPIRALGRCRSGYTSDIADGIRWAVGTSAGWTTGGAALAPPNLYPARVINLSLGGAGRCSPEYANAIGIARSRNAVVVAAAGNDKVDVANVSPANCPGVIAVAAHKSDGARASYSNFGARINLAAPGGDLTAGQQETGNLLVMPSNSGATTPGADNFWWYDAGTSFAAPHVSAVAALVIAANPGLTVDQVGNILTSSTRPFVAQCSGCGTGMLDAYGAMLKARGLPIAPLQVTPTVTGPTSSLTVKAKVKAAQLDTGRPGSLYVAAALPDGKLLALTATGWIEVTTGAAIPEYAKVTALGTHDITILNAMDATPYRGASIYAGYGLTPYDLTTNAKYQLVHTIQ